MTSKGDQKDIERRLQSIIGSMRISGGEPTEETIITMRGILSGALDADEEIERIVARYKNKPSNVESTTADDFTINEGYCAGKTEPPAALLDFYDQAKSETKTEIDFSNYQKESESEFQEDIELEEEY